MLRIFPPVKASSIIDTGIDANTDPVGLVTKIVNRINGVDSEISKKEDSLEDDKNEIKKIDSMLGAPFEFQQELNEKVAEAAQIKAALTDEGEKPPEGPKFSRIDRTDKTDIIKKGEENVEEKDRFRTAEPLERQPLDDEVHQERERRVGEERQILREDEKVPRILRDACRNGQGLVYYPEGYNHPEYEYFKSITDYHGLDLIPITDTTGLIGGYIREKNVFLNMDESSIDDMPLVKSLQHEVAHYLRKTLTGKLNLRKVDIQSPAFKKYHKTLSELNGVDMTSAEALDEFVADLEAGITDHYGINLLEGLKKDQKITTIEERMAKQGTFDDTPARAPPGKGRFFWKNVKDLSDKQIEARTRMERNLQLLSREAQEAGLPLEEYLKQEGMPEAQINRLMKYAKEQPVEYYGYREVLPDEVLPAGSDVKMDFLSGKTFVREKMTTGVKNEVVDAEREDMGLEPVRKQESKSNESMHQKAKAAVDSGEIDPRLLAQEIARKPRPITTEEEFILMYDRMRIKNSLKAVRENIEEAQRSGDVDLELSSIEKRTKLENDLDVNAVASKHGGTETARSLQARVRMINEEYTLEEILHRARMDKGRPLTNEERAKYEAMAKEIEEAKAKIAEYEEKIAKLTAQRAIQRIRNSDVIRRHLEQGKEKKIIVKQELDNEFLNLSKQLNQSLATLHFVFDPESVKILSSMAKNRVMAGVITPESIVEEIYNNLHENYPEIEKRDIRDAISGYGKTYQLSREEIDVQLREAKRQMRLISAYEDAAAGMNPLRTGFQHDKMSDQVRELNRLVRQAMRESGIDSASGKTPEEQWKTSLDAVKTRLRNQIVDLEKQLATGEKTPKKIGIKYDEEAEFLRAERDRLKEAVEKIEGKMEISEEQKIKIAMSAVEKSIAEYERRISEKDLFPGKKPSTVPETPELKELRQKRDDLKAIYKDMQNEAKPKKSPEEIALQSYKTRMANRIKELEDKLEKGDFSKKPKRTTELDEEGLTLRHKLDRAIYKYNEARLKDQLARRTLLQKMGGGIAETANFMRSLKASMDLSAVFRQGLFTVVSHPVIGARGIVPMLKAFKSDKYRFAAEEEIKARPNYKLYKDYKLELTDIGNDLTAMEETFMSRLAEKIPGVAGSQRAYTTFLNKVRADSFDLLLKNLVKKEGNFKPEEAEAITTLINEATGRGKVGMKPNTLTGLNTIFFAPRLVASRFQMLVGHSMWKGTKASRKLIAKEYGRFLAGIALVYILAELAGIEIDFDPRSSEFGKIRVGNTRIDPLGGFSQVIVFANRVARGKTKTSSGLIVPLRGDVPYGRDNTADVIWRFIRTKLAPAIGVSIDVLTGEDVVGNKVTPKNLPEKALAPMALVDTYDAIVDQGAPKGLALGMLGMLGVGLQTYDRKLKDKLTQDIREGKEDTLNEALENGLITEKEKISIQKAAREDALAHSAKNLPLPVLANMIEEETTQEQKEVLFPVFKKKLENAKKEGKLGEEDTERYNDLLENML